MPKQRALKRIDQPYVRSGGSGSTLIVSGGTLASVMAGDGIAVAGQVVSVNADALISGDFGLLVSGNDFRVKLATNSGLTFSTGLKLGTPTALNGGTTNAVSGTSHSHSVDLSHTDLSSVTADQHHNQVHGITGADHTASGLTAGHVLRATGSTTFAFGQVQHADLGGVTANQHHDQVHNITGADHTITGSAFDLVGATATNTLGLVVPSANPGAAASVLRTNAAGALTLKTLTVQGNVDITTSGDLTVGANILFVDASVGNVGINCAPDPQFDLDVLGNIRTQSYFVGRHAMQVKDALLIAHYDGQEPTATNATGEPTGHLGQPAIIVGDVRYRYGKFGKAVECSEAATNLVTNPQFDGGSTTGWTDLTGAGTGGTRDTTIEDSYLGAYSYKISKSSGATANNFGTQTDISVTNGQSYSIQCRVKVTAAVGGSQRITLNVTNLNVSASVDGVTDGWVLLTVTGTAGSTGTATVQVYVDSADTATFYLDAVQAVNKAYQVPYTAGSRLLSYLAYADVPVQWQKLTAMAWVKASSNRSGGTGTQRILDIAVDSTNRYTIFQQSGDTIRVDNGTSSQNIASGSAVDLTDWVHIAYTVDNLTAKLYINGAEVDSGTWSSVPSGLSDLYVGNRSTGSDPFGGWIDEVAIINRALPPSEILAIYESDAPVFAETSTFSFRVGGSLVWGDNEGLFARDTDGTAAFAVVGVDGKSWGGVTLDKGDVMIGNSTSGYMQFDRSAARLAMVDTDLTLLYGSAAHNKIKFDRSGVVTGEIFANAFGDTSDLQIWARAEDNTVIAGLYLGTKNEAGTPVAYFGVFGNVFNVQANANMGGSHTDVTGNLRLTESLVGYQGSGDFWAHLKRHGTSAPTDPTATAFVKLDQNDSAGAMAVLELRQADDSEEFINFNATVGTGGAIDTAALGSYYGKVRVNVQGVGFKYMPLYSS